MQDYLKQLNPAQQAAVLAKDGPVMVIAGAGSGKTRVLTFRIAHLMEQGVDPFNILALTFTNKAAREMKDRIGKIVGESETRNLWMGTFHSVFARLLRIEGHHLGYPSNFTIYDTEDAQKVINGLIKEMQLDKEIYKTKLVANRISAFKNSLITPKGYFQHPEIMEADAAARIPEMGNLYTNYVERCFRAGAMDFDDLLLKTNELLAKFPAVLAKYQDRFRYILVDEYQDTNHSQYIIVKALAARFENICVVGDDAQSIYAFRGANIRNILNFQRDYKETQQFKLEQNYRSTKVLVEAANSLISKNKEQLEKEVWTSNEQGDPITVHKVMSDTEEGQYVAQQVFETVMNKRRPYSDFAILYRTNSQSRSFEDALRRRGIPYRIYGGVSFYQRKEVKDLLAYFRLTVNSRDEEALRRVINYPARGIGATTIDRLILTANEAKLSLWDVIENIAFYPTGINKPTQGRVADFAQKIQSYAVLLQQQDAFDLAAHIAKNSGLLRELNEDKTPEGVSRFENIQELLNSIKDFTERQKKLEDGDASLGAFLQEVSLLTDADQDDESDLNKVAMMTIHLAKGLEFPFVFIVGMEENLFPNMMAMGSRQDLEEERRLFYVALTRAEKKAWLTFSHTRYRWGKLIDCEPSRFIEEIDEKYLKMEVPDFSPFSGGDVFLDDVKPWENKSSSSADRTKPSAPTARKPFGNDSGSKPAPTRPLPPAKPRNLKPLNPAPAASSGSALEHNLVVGGRVRHEKFGEGVLVELEGSGPNTKAVVKFDAAGEKKLLLKFAKLDPIN